jgi:integrase/recombinase XerD
MGGSASPTGRGVGVIEELGLWRARLTDHLQLKGFSPRTLERYGYALGPFFGFLAERGVARPAQVTREAVEAYRLHLFHWRPKGKPLSLGTQIAHLNAVKGFFRFLHEERYLLVDPAAGVAAPRGAQRLPVVLSEGEVRRLLKAPDVRRPLGLRDRAILELLYSTGLRNSELRALLLDDLQSDRGLVRVSRGKGNKSRMVPLGEEAAYWLDLYLQVARPRLARSPGERHVFVGLRGPFKTREALAEVVQRAAALAGLKKRVTPHGLRHAVATHMLRHGAGLRHLQVMLGHASAGTTQLYTRVEVGDLRRVHRRCHPRERRWAEPESES